MPVLPHKRKLDEEQSLPRDVYFSDAYFSKEQLHSLCQQLIEVRHTRCDSLLEIGMGNGFVSKFLEVSGLEVTTVDVNEALCPDIVGSVTELDLIFAQQQFDCILCAEVLEHLPFDAFEPCIAQIRAHARQSCVITLPRCDRVWSRIEISASLPLLGTRKLKWAFSHPRKSKRKSQIYEGHHWEVNSHDRCSLQSIRTILLRHFRRLNDFRFDGNPYHHFFVLST